MKIHQFFIPLLCLSNVSFAQNSEIDSLKKVLATQADDSNKVKTLNILGHMLTDNSDFEHSMKYLKEALTISEKLNFLKGKADSYQNIGYYYQQQSNRPEALKNYYVALDVEEKLQNKKNIALIEQRIGSILFAAGNTEEGIKYFHHALKLREEIKDSNGIAQTLNTLGGIFLVSKNYNEALKNHFAALKICEALGDRGANWSVPYSLTSIGEVYSAEANFESDVIQKKSKYSQALKYFLPALKKWEVTGRKAGISILYYKVANIYIQLGKFPLARAYLKKSLRLSVEASNKESTSVAYGSLSYLSRLEGNYKQAYEYYLKYIEYRDSVHNDATMQVQMKYEYGKKEAAAKAMQDKRDIVQRNIRNSIAGGFAGALVFLFIVYRQRNKIAKEKKRSEELLLNILPSEVAEELKSTGATTAKDFDSVTVLFTDFKNFTGMSEKLSAQELVNEINYCYSAFDNIITKHGIEKIKTIGDSYMCAGGLPVANKTNAIDAVTAAIEIRDFMLKEKLKRETEGKPYFEIRIGCNTGSVVAGIVGIKKFAYDIWGDTVNVASRMEASCEPGKVNISGSTYELVKDKFTCTHRGKIQAKNKGEIDMYFVEAISEL